MELDSYDSFRGEGMSAGLARGIIASHGGADVTGEGMGVGAVAMRSAPTPMPSPVASAPRATQ